MLGRPGVAIVDFAHADPKLHGNVVSVFPLTATLSYTPEQMGVILDLPPGTLTQRTLIYAVRVHPEHPASTAGQLDSHLVQEAESHSENQARMRLQGHHFWETRFHRINAILPAGLIAREVCARVGPVRAWSRRPSSACVVGDVRPGTGKRCGAVTRCTVTT